MDRTYDYRPVPFFVMAFVVTWIPWSVAAYAGSQNLESYASLFNLVGLLGPLAVALFLILSSSSEALKSDFRDRLFNLRRIRPLYLIVAIVMPPTVICLSIWLSLWFGQSTDQFRLSAGANLSALIILAVVLAPIIEEMGWRGYGVDSLRAKSGMTKATLLFGALWSAWHAPLALIGGVSEPAGGDGQRGFPGKFLHQHYPRGDHRELAVLQEQPLDRRSHPVARDAECSIGASQCRTGREVHRNRSVRGDCGRHFRDRPRGIRRGSPQFSSGGREAIARAGIR